jgi:hypothetical protein
LLKGVVVERWRELHRQLHAKCLRSSRFRRNHARRNLRSVRRGDAPVRWPTRRSPHQGPATGCNRGGPASRPVCAPGGCRRHRRARGAALADELLGAFPFGPGDDAGQRSLTTSSSTPLVCSSAAKARLLFPAFTRRDLTTARRPCRQPDRRQPVERRSLASSG